VVQALVSEAARSLEGRPRSYAELWSAAQAFLGGVVSGVLAVGSLPVVERFLGKSSRGKLRALTDFDHPILRELRERAPGTFAHTMTVLNMVEPAVEAVAGERLLSRAGTLYHDLGKTVNPYAFEENSIAGQTPAALSPSERARAMVAHVEEGLSLARKRRLPQDVTAFIAEHHGTLAIELPTGAEPAENAEAIGLRYPGPKPRSVETAILMIANAVEVETRSIPSSERATYEALVDRVILRGLADFQFDECQISQWELKLIKECLVDYLVDRATRRVNPQ